MAQTPSVFQNKRVTGLFFFGLAILTVGNLYGHFLFYSGLAAACCMLPALVESWAIWRRWRADKKSR
jgi:hypothetical protein